MFFFLKKYHYALMYCMGAYIHAGQQPALPKPKAPLKPAVKKATLNKDFVALADEWFLNHELITNCMEPDEKKCPKPPQPKAAPGQPGAGPFPVMPAIKPGAPAGPLIPGQITIPAVPGEPVAPTPPAASTSSSAKNIFTPFTSVPAAPTPPALPQPSTSPFISSDFSSSNSPTSTTSISTDNSTSNASAASATSTNTYGATIGSGQTVATQISPTVISPTTSVQTQTGTTEGSSVCTTYEILPVATTEGENDITNDPGSICDLTTYSTSGGDNYTLCIRQANCENLLGYSDSSSCNLYARAPSSTTSIDSESVGTVDVCIETTAGSSQLFTINYQNIDIDDQKLANELSNTASSGNTSSGTSKPSKNKGGNGKSKKSTNKKGPQKK